MQRGAINFWNLEAVGADGLDYHHRRGRVDAVRGSRIEEATHQSGLVTCSRCGAVSRHEGAFFWEPVSFTTKRRAICPPCWQHRDRRHAIIGLATVAVVLLGSAAGAAVEPQVAFFWLFLNLGLLWMLIIATTVPHELGHALAGRLMGISIVRIVLGRGKRVWIWESPFGVLELRAIPAGGLTFGVHRARRLFRFRQTVFLLGGALPSVAIVWAVWWLAGDQINLSRLGSTLGWRELLLISSAVVAVANLMPTHLKTQLGSFESDGLQLIKLPWRSREAIDRTIGMSHVTAAGFASMDGKLEDAASWCLRGLRLVPNHPLLRFQMATVRLQQLQAEEARDVFIELLEQQELEPHMNLLLKNNIAWADFLIGTPDRLTEADNLSRSTLEEVPWNPYVISTRGCILLSLGQLGDAIELLGQALSRHETLGSKAIAATYLAIAEHRRGNPAVAFDHLTTARTLDPGCPFLPAAHAELRSHAS